MKRPPCSAQRNAPRWPGPRSVTRVEQTRVPDADYQQALSVLGEQTLADLTVAVTLMNAFNRFGVSMRMHRPRWHWLMAGRLCAS
jgi:hypothetical protein